MSKEGKNRKITISAAIIIWVVAFLAFVLLWYFVLFMAPSIIGALTITTDVGTETTGTFEKLQVADQLSAVVLRWGIIPIYIGGIGDLTLPYIGYLLITAIIMGIWVRRRW